jgi:hypothetical protein
MVWEGFLEEYLQVVLGWPGLTLVNPCGGQDAPHVGATCLPIVAIIVVGHGRTPLKVLLVPLFATLATLPTIVDGNVRRCSLAVALGHLSASLGRVKHDRLTASVVLCGDAMRQLKCVPAKVAMLALERVPRTVL